MIYILDTNICVHMLNNQSIGILKHAKNKQSTVIYISSITEAELWYGVMKSSRANENIPNLRKFLELFPRLPFDSTFSHQYGLLRHQQTKMGKQIGENDFFIAAQALELDAILVTANEKEFKKIKDLRIENWLK